MKITKYVKHVKTSRCKNTIYMLKENKKYTIFLNIAIIRLNKTFGGKDQHIMKTNTVF